MKTSRTSQRHLSKNWTRIIGNQPTIAKTKIPIGKNQQVTPKEMLPPHDAKAKPVDSPLRRPRSLSDEELSELDKFIDDP